MKDKFKEKNIGLIPAAGFANRISPIPCSKEVYPIGFSSVNSNRESHLRVVSSFLIESMHLAGVDQIIIVIRESKWDIPAYYLNGDICGVNMAYVVVDKTEGTPFTLDKAYPFSLNKQVFFGFPDIIFKPKEAFRVLAEKKIRTGADIVLGLFEANNPSKVDMVELNELGKVQNIIIKPDKTDLTYTWIIAVWSPVFTQFMNNFISDTKNGSNKKNKFELKDTGQEIYVGDVIQDAIKAGLDVDSVIFSHGSYIDIGTKDDLKKAMEVYL